MLTQESVFSFHDMNPQTKTISITNITIVKDDNGNEIAQSNHTKAFAPGDIEDVKTYINATDTPEITYLNSIWSADAIAAWKALEE